MNQEGEQGQRKRGGGYNGHNRGRRGGNHNRGGGGGGGNYGGRYNQNRYPEQGGYNQRQNNYQERDREAEEGNQQTNKDDGQLQYKKNNNNNYKRPKKDHRERPNDKQNIDRQHERQNGQNQSEHPESQTGIQDETYSKSEQFGVQHDSPEEVEQKQFSKNNYQNQGEGNGDRKNLRKKRPRLQEGMNQGQKDRESDFDRERGNQKPKDWGRDDYNQYPGTGSSEVNHTPSGENREYYPRDNHEYRGKKGNYDNQHHHQGQKQGPYRKKYPEMDPEARNDGFTNEYQDYTNQNHQEFRVKDDRISKPKTKPDQHRGEGKYPNDPLFSSQSQVSVQSPNLDNRSNPYGIPINNSNEVSTYGSSIVQSIHSSRFARQDSDLNFSKPNPDKRFENPLPIRTPPNPVNMKDMVNTVFAMGMTPQPPPGQHFPIPYQSPQSSKNLFQKSMHQEHFEMNKMKEQLGSNFYPPIDQSYPEFNNKHGYDQSNKKKGKKPPNPYHQIPPDGIPKQSGGVDEGSVIESDFSQPPMIPKLEEGKKPYSQLLQYQQIQTQLQSGFHPAPLRAGEFETRKQYPSNQLYNQAKRPKVEREFEPEAYPKYQSKWNPYQEFTAVKPKTFSCPVESHNVHKFLFEINNEYYRQNQVSEFEPYYNYEEAKDLVSKDRAFRGKIKFKQGLNSFAVIQSDDFVKNVFCSGMGLNRAIHGSDVIFCPTGNDWQRFLVINQTEATKNYQEIERQEVFSEEQNYYNFMKKRYSEEVIIDEGPNPVHPTSKIFAQIIYIEKNPLQEAPFVLRLRKDKQNIILGHNIKSNKYPPFKIASAEKSSKLDISMNHYYLAKFEKWSHNEKQPTASLISDLGQEGLIETEIQAILNMNDIAQMSLNDEKVQSLKQHYGIEDPVGYQIPEEELAKREDFRENLVLAIGQRDVAGFQQAYSVVQEEEGSFTLGVHIIDVSYFIEKDTPLDIQASKKAQSLKLPNKNVRIFPDYVNEDLCSFKVGKDRLALSILMTVNNQGVVQIDSTKLCKSVVNCKSSFNFEMMEAIFMGQISATENTELQDLQVSGCTVQEIIKAVKTLKNLMNLRRNKKLDLSYSFDVETSSEKTFTIDPVTQKPVSWEYKKESDAEKIIKECLNLANIQMAEYLTKNCPKLAIFFSQEEPKQHSLLNLARLIPKIIATIPTPIIEALRFKPQIFQSLNLNQFNLVRFFEKTSVLNLTPSSLSALTTLFNLTPELHRNFFDHMLKKVLNPVSYQMNDKNTLPDISLKHYTHNFKLISHFTKPLDRYLDLLIHRILGWILDKKDPNAYYTNHEILAHCAKANKIKRSTVKAQKQIQKLYFGFWMQSLPIPKQIENNTGAKDGVYKHFGNNIRSIESEALVVELGRCLVKLWVFELNSSITLNLARDYICKYFQKDSVIQVPNNFVSSETELIQGVSPTHNISYVKVTSENLSIQKDTAHTKKSKSKKVHDEIPHVLTLTLYQPIKVLLKNRAESPVSIEVEFLFQSTHGVEQLNILPPRLGRPPPRTTQNLQQAPDQSRAPTKYY